MQDNNIKEALIIINPISGTRDKESLWEAIESRFHKEGLPFTTHYTTGPDDARKFAREAARRGSELMVVTVGGDGTINEVATGLCGSGVPLAIIPCGSGNGLARTLQIPQTPSKALDIIFEGNCEKCDCGTVNGRYFFCTFGLGFDAAVAHKFAGARRRGKLTYLRNAFEEYLNFRSAPYALAIDNEVIVKEAFIIAVCNVPQYGNNVYIAPEASFNDGWLDITLIRNGSPVDTVRTGVGMLAGSFGANKTIESFRVKKATITRLTPGPVQIDGEPFEMGTRLEIECVENALSVFMPKERHKFKPIVTPAQSFFSDLRDDFLHLFNNGR